jgi:putative resolvase
MNLISIDKASKLIGVSQKTLRLWEKDNKINVIYTPNGHRRYDYDYIINNFLKKENKIDKNKLNIIYGRVSTNNQKSNLENQINLLKDFCMSKGIIINDIYTDIGSGLNYKRPNFIRLINQVLDNKINSIIISYPDRLTRFSFNFFIWLFEKYNVSLIIANNIEISEEQEMTNDLISIIQHYESKLYGKRSYKNKAKLLIDNIKDEEVVG